MSARLRQRRCRGQAATEYTVILALVVIVLIAFADNPSVIEQLVEAMRSAYSAFSYVLSFSV